MTDVRTDAELRFEAPGPGSWGLDPVHFPRPVTRYWSETHPEGFWRGTHDFSVYYGLLLDGMHTAYINGFCYNTAVPAPEAEIPQRIQHAQEVFDQEDLAGPASGVGRDGQAGRHGGPPRDPGHRSRWPFGE